MPGMIETLRTAMIINNLKPQDPKRGPPLPTGIGIKWPEFILKMIPK